MHHWFGFLKVRTPVLILAKLQGENVFWITGSCRFSAAVALSFQDSWSWQFFCSCMFRGSILNPFSFLESKHNLKRRLQQWSPQCNSKTYIIKWKRRRKKQTFSSYHKGRANMVTSVETCLKTTNTSRSGPGY